MTTVTEMDGSQKIFKNTGWKLIQSAATGVAEFLIMFILARWFKPETYGLLALGLSIVAVFKLFASAGIPNSTTKFIAEYKGTHDEKARYFVFSGLFMGVCLGILASTICFVGSGYISILFSNGKLRSFLQIAALLIVFENLMVMLEAVFRGVQDFRVPAVATIISRSLQIGLIFLVLYLGSGINGVVGAMIGGVVIAIVVLLIRLPLLFSLKVKTLFYDQFIKTCKQNFQYSILIGIYIFAYYFFSEMDIIFLGFFSDSREIGYYRLARQFYLLPVAVFIAQGMAIGPFVASEFGKKNREILQVVFEKAQTFCLAFVLPLAFGLFAFSGLIVKRALPDYEPAVILIRIFSILVLFTAISKICELGFLIPTGNASLLAKVVLAGGILKVILALLLIPKYAALGAALATLIAQGATIFIILYLTLSKLQLTYKIVPHYIYAIYKQKWDR